MYDNEFHAQRYRQADVGSMSPEKMIVALYERVLRDLDNARIALDGGDLATYNTEICHAQAIVTELRGSLDHSVGGEIAGNLDALYDFVFRKLLGALADRDADALKTCRTVLEPLLKAWRQVPAGAGQKEAERRAQEAAGSGADPATQTGESTNTADPVDSESHFCVTV